jgi:hypothetical protein
MRVASTIDTEVRLSCIRLYAIVLLLLSLIGTEVLYVPVGEFKLSAYRFFLFLFPVVLFFIPYKQFAEKLIANAKYIVRYWLLAWLPHALFSVYWSDNFAFTDNLIFFTGSIITALILAAFSAENFIKIFYLIETSICILGFVCCIQYLINYFGIPLFSVGILDGYVHEIIMLGTESYQAMEWWNLNANVFLFAAFLITTIGYFLTKKKTHIFFSVFFILIYYFAN